MPARMFSRQRALLVCATAVVTALICAALSTAAMLAPAPAGAVPVIVLVCLAGPMVAAWELPAALVSLRRHSHTVASMRRGLAQLPEVEHPLGL